MKIKTCRSGLKVRRLRREATLGYAREALKLINLFAGKSAATGCLLGFLWLIPVHAADTLDLDGATITGSQELPKALHIVPWKSADTGDLAGRPLNSLVDEILAPIDRDVFLRELEYYEAVHSSE